MVAGKFTYEAGGQPLPGFTIVEPLGKGEFGEVYHALSDGGKDVALKLVLRHHEVELRGVQTCMNLSHPRLVQIIDVKTEADKHWIVMEFVKGESLADAIRRSPHGIPFEQVRQWLDGIGEAVDYLHSRGIVHRDLKPSNIFIDQDDGLVKIGDYGLSKFITPSQRSGQTKGVGTVDYMAPEVSDGRYNQEVDVYAVGCILFEMLTGRPPFCGESPAEILMRHLTTEPDLSHIPVEYKRSIQKALAKSPDDRWHTVTEMARAADRLPDTNLTRSAYRAVSQLIGSSSAPTLQRRAIAGMNVGALTMGLVGSLYALIVWLLAIFTNAVAAFFVGYSVFGVVCGKIMADAIWDSRTKRQLHVLSCAGWGIIGAIVAAFALVFGGLGGVDVPARVAATGVGKTFVVQLLEGPPQRSLSERPPPDDEHPSEKILREMREMAKFEEKVRRYSYDKWRVWMQYQFVWLVVSICIGLVFGGALGWTDS